MTQLSETLGGLILAGGFVLIVYFIARFTYLTKRMLAEKNMLRKDGTHIDKLDVAWVIIGLGVGLLIAAGFSLLELKEDTMDLLSWGVILISGACGLIIAAKRRR